jgi:hypothetical protein
MKQEHKSERKSTAFALDCDPSGQRARPLHQGASIRGGGLIFEFGTMETVNADQVDYQ